MKLIKSLYNFPLLRIPFRSRVYKTAITEIHRDDPLLTPRAAQRVLQKICAFGRSNNHRRLKSPSAEAPPSGIHFFRLPFCSIFEKNQKMKISIFTTLLQLSAVFGLRDFSEDRLWAKLDPQWVESRILVTDAKQNYLLGYFTGKYGSTSEKKRSSGTFIV